MLCVNMELFVSELFCVFFFFDDTATTEIYTLSLHDALPIFRDGDRVVVGLVRPQTVDRDGDRLRGAAHALGTLPAHGEDRKSTRLNSSHSQISYAVFCLKKKKKQTPKSTETRSHR